MDKSMKVFCIVTAALIVLAFVGFLIYDAVSSRLAVEASLEHLKETIEEFNKR